MQVACALLRPCEAAQVPASIPRGWALPPLQASQTQNTVLNYIITVCIYIIQVLIYIFQVCIYIIQDLKQNQGRGQGSLRGFPRCCEGALSGFSTVNVLRHPLARRRDDADRTPCSVFRWARRSLSCAKTVQVERRQACLAGRAQPVLCKGSASRSPSSLLGWPSAACLMQISCFSIKTVQEKYDKVNLTVGAPPFL